MASSNDTSFHFDRLPQPSWAHSDLSRETLQPVLESVLFKLTRIGVVVKRGVALFKDRCTTYHDPEKKTDASIWMLDRSCILLPATPAELTTKKRGIRPKGTWAITAAVQGVETYVELYELTVDWPSSWAAAGYTSLVLGFPDRAQAAQWHRAITQVLADLGAGSKGQSRVESAPPGAELTTTSVTAAAPKADDPVSAATGVLAVNANSTQSASLPQTLSAVMAQSSQAESLEFADASFGGASKTPEVNWEDGEDDFPSDTDSDNEEHENDTATPDGQRWVPYRQTNGVAIYYHAAEGAKEGGEYMVSCVIRGRPQRVAAALMRLRGNTTILGPVAHAEMLQPADGSGNGKDIMRVVLTASGYAGYFCAPREIILERMRKDEEDGVTVILFKSVDLPNEADAKGKPKGGLFGSGMWRRPVRGVVAGGYTVAGLRGEGAASRESLVTCIVKADLGGMCGPRSWARPLVSAAGWTDAFLDRILMSVHLLRDEVEQRRFSVQPFKLVASAKARFNEDGAVVGGGAAAARAAQAASGPSAGGGRMASFASGSVASGDGVRRPPSVSLSTRPLARMASQRTGASFTDGAAAAPVAPAIPEEEGVSLDVDISSMRLDRAHVRSLASMPRKYWSEIHVPGTDAPFHVRGPTYLKDKKKVLAGSPAFQLGAMELVALPPPGTQVAGEPTGANGVVEHVCRFVPSVRHGGAPFSIIINLVVPGSPMLSMLAVFCCDKHPSILGTPPARPMDEPHDWQPFDFVLHKFVYGSEETRNKMLKLVPHIASGSWMIKQSVGTTPVILGKALKTTYHCTPTYIEVDIDISANSVANYVTGMVRGATASLDIDMAFVLEGTAPWELPECLLGALRLNRLDCKAASVPLDWSKELPLTAGSSASASKL